MRPNPQQELPLASLAQLSCIHVGPTGTVMEVTYCWKCGRDVAMFDDAEWARLGPLLESGMESVKSYRAEHEVALSDVPIRSLYADALVLHERIAGHSDVQPQEIWHHRRSSHGPACPRCGKPFRTPAARQCAACGFRLGAVQQAPGADEPRGNH